MKLDGYDRAVSELGQALCSMRRNAGLTQLELKRAIGMRRSHIDAVEEGLQPVDFYGLWRWAEACGKAVAVTFAEAGDPMTLSSDEQAHLGAVRRLEPEVRVALFAMVAAMAGEPPRE